ncbi:MAG: dTDP-4-dehydrorhamnose reductase [Levilactobacillus sp.]|jgi:dTDP-4-dehydrorhamnose reductase|uniref:dTDP-4-dehydrorhamnose reductase n=1 Tax=Levilactobacillus sp. TaxID=2767919 RepID=UPI00258715FF|nr:dTDP-4-dehydrorhamnose reductase [Levilactobacillus sp.]MCH4123835.1 dTDP-4-dehydrorhamnose reductase [Levilactobacillus sp.]MCI1553933.1 dTDP-4-dehydrorhamnose reductase [Levilactobacillus sp.]
MKILITGASGQLGTELRHLLDSRGIEYLAMDSTQLDITDAKAVDIFFENERPSVVYDCAAYTAVDAAEEEPGKTTNGLVNVEGTRNLAIASERVKATLVYISTDYVFDGTNSEMYSEEDSANPKNQYGLAKYQGEQLVQKIMSKYYIIRTSWVFGKYGKNFVYTMLKLAETHDELSVVDDQVGRPTWTKTLADFMTYAVENRIEYGIYQLSNDNSCSWFEFASEILKDKQVTIHPVDSSKFPQKAYRPKHSVMSLEKAKSTGFSVISWQEALRKFKSDL